MATRVESLFDGELGAPATRIERETAQAVGDAHVVLGGPPCQGHSDLNNHTRRNDPRNSLYARMARMPLKSSDRLSRLSKTVPAVVHSAEDVVEITRASIEAAVYTTSAGVIESCPVLVFHSARRRHVLVAARISSGVDADTVSSCVKAIASTQRSTGWALNDLVGHAHDTVFDTPTRVSPKNAKRIQWLFDHDAYDLPYEFRPPCHQGAHSYRSMYGRLRWNEPAQTITTRIWLDWVRGDLYILWNPG